MNCAIYARVSTDQQTCDHQLRELRNYSIAHGWQATEYVDQGISGSKESRPALNRLLADMRAGKVNVLLVWSWDRLARSVRQLLAIFEECQKLRIGIISHSQNIDTTTDMGKCVFTIMGAIAELERAMIRERVKSGLKAAKSRGVRLGAKPIHDQGTILRLRLKGQSVRSIAKELNIPRSSVGRIVEKSGATARSD